MNKSRMSMLVAVVAAGALALAGCSSSAAGSNTSAAGSSPSSSSAGGSSTGTSTGSTAVASSGSVASGSAAADPSSAGGSGSAAAGGATSFSGAGFSCATGSLRSDGSTAQGNVMAAWISAYNKQCAASINTYGGGGSGKGVSDFIANQTDFSGSDSAMTASQLSDAQSKRCNGNPALDLPMVTGPIAVVYNLPGNPQLTFTPKVLVGIFGGTIKNWNDAAIAAANPGVQLPNLGIQTVHRSEASGTTDNFTKYLTAAGGWTYAGGKSWTAPGGTGAQGSDGVAKAVAGTSGAIAYDEWSYATANKLTIAKIDNGAGAVALSNEAAGVTVSTAKIVGTGKDLSLSIDYATKAAGAYPVVLVTYELVCSAGNGDKAALLKSFLGWMATTGQTLLGPTIGSAPLPASIQAKVIAAVQGIS